MLFIYRMLTILYIILCCSFLGSLHASFTLSGACNGGNLSKSINSLEKLLDAKVGCLDIYYAFAVPPLTLLSFVPLIFNHLEPLKLDLIYNQYSLRRPYE